MAKANHYTRGLHFFLSCVLLLQFLVPNASLLAREEDITSEALSVLLVIDVSGSMARTDPEMLRETAACVFIDLLSPEDHLGIVAFDHDAEIIIPLQKVGGSANKARIKEILSSSLMPRGYTDFKKALETTLAQFQEADLAGTRPSVVLLTDGEPNPGPEYGEDPELLAQYLTEFWELAEGFAEADIPVYTVGFSDEIDPIFIEKLSLVTRGDYYIHEEPQALVRTFFVLLSDLKKRRVLFQETYYLQDEEKAFTLPVDLLTRQMNLVAVNLGGEEVQLTLQPPRGTAQETGSVSIDAQPGYSMAVLSQPAEEFWGEWAVSLYGSGEIQFMADKDLHLQFWLEKPGDDFQHPLGEPLPFQVNLMRSPTMLDTPLRVEIMLTKPDSSPFFLELENEDDYFTGVYQDVDRTGNYEVQARILLDGEVVSTVNRMVYVRNLPFLSTDFWREDVYRLGEELQVTASLNMGGRRLPQGMELQLDHIGFVFVSDEGARVDLPLFDNGSADQGDLRAGDGIFSNFLVFKEEGAYEGSLVASGTYRGAEFMLEKVLEPFEVKSPGTIMLRVFEERTWGVPGKKATLKLEVINNAGFPETLQVEQSEGFIHLESMHFPLAPGERKIIQLPLVLDDELAYGIYEASLLLRAENDSTAVEPSVLNYKLEVLHARQAFFRNFSGLIISSGFVLSLVLLVGALIIGGGFVLYRVVVYPRTKVGGSLEVFYFDNPGHAEPKNLLLWKLKKNPVVIGMGKGNPEADFRIENSEFTYEIIIQARWDIRYPRFLQGWKALVERRIPIRVFVKCTPPGVIEQDGQIYTEKELYHYEEFESGGVLLRYNNPYGKWYKEAGDGLDVLQA